MDIILLQAYLRLSSNCFSAVKWALLVFPLPVGVQKQFHYPTLRALAGAHPLFPSTLFAQSTNSSRTHLFLRTLVSMHKRKQIMLTTFWFPFSSLKFTNQGQVLANSELLNQFTGIERIPCWTSGQEKIELFSKSSLTIWYSLYRTPSQIVRSLQGQPLHNEPRTPILVPISSTAMEILP